MVRKLNDDTKKWLFFAVMATFFWGFLAHSYCFFDNNFSHDSLLEFNASYFSAEHKIKIGRIVVPLYWMIFRGNFALPWLSGCLGLLWTSLAVFLVLRLFQIRSKVTAFLTAGIFMANISVIATAATYFHDFDSYLFGVLCAVTAAYLWKQDTWCSLLLGVLFAATTLGVFQWYLFIIVTLIMFDSILELFKGKTFQQVLFRGIKALGMIGVGGVLYLLVMKTTVWLSGYAMYDSGTNSMNRIQTMGAARAPQFFVGIYTNWFETLMTAPSGYGSTLISGITILLFVAVGGLLVYGLCCRKLGLWERLLGLALVLFLPVGMNGVYFLSVGDSQILRVLSVWLFYLLALLLTDWYAAQLPEKKARRGSYQRIGCACLVAVLLYGNVQLANILYMKKDMDYDAYLSLMTRVADRMEQQEEYVPGETPVVFVGLPRLSDDLLRYMAPGFERYGNITGMWSTDVIYDYTDPRRYQAYFDNVLGVYCAVVDEETWYQTATSEIVAQMPSFPDSGCVAMQDGRLVVKLSDYID